MDHVKMGSMIKILRNEMQMTQKELAEKLCVSDKTISKWECGRGCPDPSLWPELSSVLKANIEDLLNGNLSPNTLVGGNMKNTKYYVCPSCGSITFCSGNASVSCCGRKLELLAAQKAGPDEKLTVETIEDDWFITSKHPMGKDNFISFIAFATGDRIQIYKQYPEWEIQTRIQRCGHGKLLWYSTTKGLYYQLI